MSTSASEASHPWVRMCEEAQCSPDFDVVYGFGKADAVNWLRRRLLGRGFVYPLHTVTEAYDSWPPDGQP